MEINSETLELLERRLGENVEKRVRGRLFLAYGAAATAFLTAFGYFGYDLVSNAKTKIDAAVTTAEKDLLKKVVELEERAEAIVQAAVTEPIESAKAAAQKAEGAADKASLRLTFIEDLTNERAARLTLQEDKINQSVATMELQLEVLRGNIKDTQTTIDEAQIAFAGYIEEAQDQLGNQRENLNEYFAGAGDLSKLGGDLGVLAEQVGLLKQQISELREASAGVPHLTDEVSLELIQQVAKTYEQQEADPGRAIELPTVYFQFAGVKRGLAEEISKKLAALGYTMPGEERLGSAAGKKEVRYFFDSDAEHAHRLAKELNRLLTANGFEADVTVKNYTVYKAAKPRPGTLELWLEPVRRG